MAKQFVQGNKYVFTSKKYLQWARLNCEGYGTWHKDINGMEVDIVDFHDGYAERTRYGVSPEWCKCIKNSQGRV
ncbi:hypothetical protein FDC51_19825 [Clostridium botulinum]|nr:hypothetical protein [Clostridium botulinum]